jgi:hypothetical protein
VTVKSKVWQRLDRKRNAAWSVHVMCAARYLPLAFLSRLLEDVPSRSIFYPEGILVLEEPVCMHLALQSCVLYSWCDPNASALEVSCSDDTSDFDVVQRQTLLHGNPGTSQAASELALSIV